MPNTKSLSDLHPILNWFIQNSVAANLLMVGILLTGLYMVGFFGLFEQTAKLRLEAFPSQESSTITINVSLNGSTPEDVELGVTDKIEQALQSIQGIDKITSESSSDSALIFIDAVTDYNMDKLFDDIKMQVDSIGTLPTEVEKVIVKKAAWQPSILWVTLHGDVSDRVLKTKANLLKDRLLASPYIEKINIDGEKTSEISIEVSEEKLKEYDLTLDKIATAVNNASLDLSSGNIETAQGKLNLRIKAQAKTQTDYENLIIHASADGSLVRLGDIANVKDDFTEQDLYVGFNGKPSLTLRLKSGKQANVIEADKAATDIVNKFSETLPDNLTATVWNNRVSFVKDRINLFARNSASGVVLVFLLLTLFLNVRLAFWVALGIPISFAGALIMMKMFDISISLISLFGFILVLGIVVDDAIIIGESIYSWKKRTNNAPDATLRGTARVSVAATFGVLTTVAAFLPLTQVDSDMGNILGQIGAVVIFCLLFSLLESKFILPSHLHHTKVATVDHKPENRWEQLQASIAHKLEILVEKTYMPVLAAALRQRYFTLLAFISIFILAIGTVISDILPVAMMPQIESQDISVMVEMNKTVNVDETISLAKKTAQDLRIADKKLMQAHNTDNPNVTHISAFNMDDTNFMVRAGLADAESRVVSAPEIANSWRKVVGDIPEAKSITFSSRRRFSDADIELRLLSNNRTNQQAAGQALIKALGSIKGVIDIANSQNKSAAEIRIQLKPEANTYGISKKQLAQTIRSAFYGQESERLQRDNEEVKVIVRYPKSERESLSNLYKLEVRTADGSAIPIIEVANLAFNQSPENIEHINSNRSLMISANVNKDETSVEDVMDILVTTVLPKLQQDYDIDINFGGETEEDAKAEASMKLGFIISLIMIYVLLAIPLKSYTHPIIIMSVIPFGIIGAIIGHLFLGMNISILSFFGMIALSGVVVNDSLLLLSSIQQHSDEGMDLRQAITVTGVRRFRPIILTSITTFVGLLPMLFETSFQAKFLIPMTVSLGFGILFATLITLILVPVIYYIFYDIKNFLFTKTTN